MKHIVAILLCSVFFAVIGTLSPVHASDMKYIWNGNEKIIGVGGKFEEMKFQKQDKDNDATGVSFELDRTSLGGNQYKNAGTLNLSYESESAGGVGALCIIQSMSLVVDRSTKPAKVTGVIVHEAFAKSSGFDPVAWLRNATDTCKAWANGKFGADGSLVDPYKQNIEGNQGQNPIIYRFENQLSKMKERETKHYVNRVCSLSKPEPRCTDTVRKTYEIMWDTCRNKVLSSGELTEDSIGLPDSENAGNKVVDEFSDCIKDYSGLDINQGLLAYQTSIDLIEGENPKSCSVPYIGYVVCPLSRFMAAIVDRAFDAFKNFFEITPLDRGTAAGDLLFETWSVMRNFANVVFAIVFILVIMAQVSSFGISNYGIKRLLPKLIIMAILMNLSYVICTFAIDISNILGNSLRDVIKLMEPTVTIQPDTWGSQVEQIIVYSSVVSGIGLVLLTGSLVALFPLLVGAAISLLVTIVIILARYAIILGLTIVSPLAFACTLLPGTRSWYDKWLSLFMSMLALYPVISVVFGGSTIASMIVMNSSLSHATGSISLQLFGLAIQFLPLAITPLLIKLGGSLLGQVGNKVQGSGVFGKARKNADAFASRKKNARDVKALRNFGDNRRKGLPGLRDRVIQGRYRRKGIQSMRSDEMHKANQDYISGYVSGTEGYGGEKKTWLGMGNQTRGDKFAAQMAAGGGSVGKVKSDALRAQATITAKEVEVNKLAMRAQPMQAVTQAASDPAVSESIRQAAIEIVRERGMPEDINKVVKSSRSMTPEQRRTTASAAAAASPLYATPEAQQAIIEGRIDESQPGANFTSTVVAPAITNGSLSANDFGRMDAHTLGEVEKGLSHSSVDQVSAQTIRDQARDAYNNEQTHGRTDRESREALRRLAGL